MLVSAQEHHRLNYSAIGYQTLDWNQHTLFAGFGDNFNTNRYVLESCALPITLIGKDPFNNQKLNFAVPIVPFLYFNSLPTTGSGEDEFNTIRILSLIFSSRHQFFLLDQFIYSDAQWPRYLSVFYKHDLNWFAFRSNQWIDFSPGVGIAFYFSNYSKGVLPFTVQFAIVRDIAISTRSTKYSTVYSLQISLLGRND